MRIKETYLIAWTTYGTWQYDGRAVSVGEAGLAAGPRAVAADD